MYICYEHSMYVSHIRIMGRLHDIRYKNDVDSFLKGKHFITSYIINVLRAIFVILIKVLEQEPHHWMQFSVMLKSPKNNVRVIVIFIDFHFLFL